MAKKITTLTQLIQELSAALDSANQVSVEEVKDHILQQDLIPWLRNSLQGEGIDLSVFLEDEVKYLHTEFESMVVAYNGNERRNWGIEKNGLCLLISWATEAIRQLPEHSR